MLSCPRCGGVNSEAGPFCQFCGASLSGPSAPATAVLACASCGNNNPSGTNFCHHCGARLESGAPPAQPSAGARPDRPPARLVAVRRDGTDGDSYRVEVEQFDIGRTEGEFIFEDPHMAPRHARILFRNGQHVVQPLEVRNGVYVRVRQPVELFDGDHFLIGKQVLRFEMPLEVEKTLRPAVEHGVVFFGTPVLPPWGRLRQLTAAGTTRDVYHLTRSEVTFGREQGDIVFGDDEFLSRRHAQLHYISNRVTLVDLGSSNGSFVRLRGQHLLSPGEQIRIGDELLRFEIG
jgi:pSer/pThr/pTyr-binding forkhead associated (FHA) protein